MALVNKLYKRRGVKMDSKLFKTLRQLNQLTQLQAADRLKVSRALLALVETDKTPISRALERKVNEEFGLEQIEHVKKTMDLLNRNL
ncbi:helix-turn-helix transcriptional regulator [Halobacillus dabanensis]|nr:helix-turn-helix transcriptional regulator [Halobacillus dabanensis]